jgi:hypothetical protein
MSELHEQKRLEISRLLSNLDLSISSSFKGSREGLLTIDVDKYLHTRDLLLQLVRSYDAEVYRVCFEERLSNRSGQ